MEARKDFEIFHEPTNAPYDAIHERAFYDLYFRNDCFQSYQEITDTILSQSQNANVFVKEMAFTLPEYLTLDNPLLQKAHFVFLIRKPQDTILSFYQKGVPASRLQDLTGYQQLLELYKLVEANAKHPPHLIISEELGEFPSKTVASFCKAVDIPFLPESLTWENLGNDFSGKKWRDGKIAEALHHWQGDAIRSTCFYPLRTAEVDSEGNPTFAEVENLEDRVACQKAYAFFLPTYLELKKKREFDSGLGLP